MSGGDNPGLVLPAAIPIAGHELDIQVVVERALPAVPDLASAVGVPRAAPRVTSVASRPLELKVY